MVTPADGPSLGMAPAGTCTCRSFWCEEGRVDAERRGLRADVADGGARRLLHDVAELAGQDDLAVPPGSIDASMKSTSPPASVQARPVATPGAEVRKATSFLNRAGPR